MARTGRPREFDEDQVVDAATDLFWSRGYGATSVQDIVDHLGLARGSLYGTFGDKHGLFLRALKRYAEDADALMCDLDAGGPVLPAIRALLLGVLRPTPGTPARGCMMGNTAVELVPVDEAATAAVRAAFAANEAALRRALERARRTGELPATGDPGAQARFLLTMLQGLQVVAKTEPDPARLEDAVDAALAALT